MRAATLRRLTHCERGDFSLMLSAGNHPTLQRCSISDCSRKIGRDWLKSIEYFRACNSYGDVVLNDGAPNGEHEFAGRVTRPDEIERWSPSGIPTVVNATSGFRDSADRQAFLAHLELSEIPHTDWSNVRILCRRCSEGRPPSDHDHRPAATDGIFGFGAYRKRVLQVLDTWANDNPAITFTSTGTSRAYRRNVTGSRLTRTSDVLPVETHAAAALRSLHDSSSTIIRIPRLRVC